MREIARPVGLLLPWWARSLLWAFSSFLLAAATYPVYAFGHAVRHVGLLDAPVALFADFVFGASAVWCGICACVAVLLLPALLAWGVIAPRVPSLDRTWVGVAVGTAGLAAFGVAVGASLGGVTAWIPVLPAAAVAWGALCLPRGLCRTLRPGQFSASVA